MEGTIYTNTSWTGFPGTLRYGDRICCNIDGTAVSGTVFFSDKDISVVSETPKAGLRGGSHIMMMAPYTFRNSDGTGNSHAVKAAREILPELWAGYLRLLAVAPTVSEGLERYNAEYDRMEEEILSLKEKRAALKRALSNGATDNRTYQKELSPIMKGIEQLKLRQWNLFEDMFHVNATCGYRPENSKEILSSIIGKEIR